MIWSILLFSFLSIPSMTISFKLLTKKVPKSIFNQTSAFLFIYTGISNDDQNPNISFYKKNLPLQYMHLYPLLNILNFLRNLPSIVLGSTDQHPQLPREPRNQNYILQHFSDYQILSGLLLVQQLIPQCLVQVKALSFLLYLLYTNFRYIIIQNADHGLHVKGSVNMRLLTGVYWMFFIMLVSIASTFMPLTQILAKTKSYPQNIIFGKICLELKLNKQNSDGIIPTYGLKGFIFPIIYCSMIAFWNMKIQSMMKTQCSSFKTFSCYGGKYRRNLQTFKENLAQSIYWIIFIVLENVLVVFLKMYSEELGERNIFIIYNTLFVIFGDFMTGFLLPIKYIMLSRRKYQILWMSSVNDPVNERSPKSSVKIPRREFTPEKLKISMNSSNSVQRTMNKYIIFPSKENSSISVIEIE